MPRFYAVAAVIQVPTDWDRAAVQAFIERQVLSSAGEKASLAIAEVSAAALPESGGTA